MIIGSHKLNFDHAFCCTFPDKMVSNADMFSTPMVHWIFDEVNCSFLSTFNSGALLASLSILDNNPVSESPLMSHRGGGGE
jgi:hypothetical protein